MQVIGKDVYMVDNAAERTAIIEWFKSGFSKEAAATTKTSRLEDGKLSYSFSVTNTSEFDFAKFKFKVRVLDKESGAEIAAADINAGEWPRAAKKNFTTRLSVPPDAKNLTFVMYAESIDYEIAQAGLSEAVRGMAEAAKGLGDAVSKAGEGIAKPVGTFTQRKNEKRLNKKRLGKSGWVVAGIVTAVIFLMAAFESDAGSYDQITFGAVGAVSLIAALVGKASLNKRAKLIRAYETKVNKNGNTSIDDLASYVGRPFEKVADDLHQMITDGFFPECYVDIDNRLLVMTKNGQPVEDVARSAAMNKKARRQAARDGALVPESLDDLITMTDDGEIKSKLKSLRTITKKIDVRVEEVPDLEKQVRDFREKYYPEVVRLTDEYNEKIVDMGKYGEENVKPEISESADGAPVLNTNPNYLQEQAAEIKSQLINLIDSVTEASENLLEKLHEGDIMDITTDIKMLQTTLASKGLLDSDFDIKLPED